MIYGNRGVDRRTHNARDSESRLTCLRATLCAAIYRGKQASSILADCQLFTKMKKEK